METPNPSPPNRVLKQNGEPSPSTGYLLNGDIADRGEHACEILIITLLYKLLYPEMVNINRCLLESGAVGGVYSVGVGGGGLGLG